MATCFGPSLDHLKANIDKQEVQSVCIVGSHINFSCIEILWLLLCGLFVPSFEWFFFVEGEVSEVFILA
jgi:hypothetical protein